MDQKNSTMMNTARTMPTTPPIAIEKDCGTEITRSLRIAFITHRSLLFQRKYITKRAVFTAGTELYTCNIIYLYILLSSTSLEF